VPVATERFGNRWRSSTTRLLLVYGMFFVAWSVVLIAAISWQTAHYLDSVVDRILEQRAHYLASVDRAHLPPLLNATAQLDLQGAMSAGLFDAQGHYVTGDIDRLPERIEIDGLVHDLPGGVRRVSGEHATRIRAVALRLDDGSIMLLARDYGAIDRVGAIIRGARCGRCRSSSFPACSAVTCSGAARCAACGASRPRSSRSCAATSARACRYPDVATNSTCWPASSTACSTRSSACLAK
jgi:hypothetical protein